MFDSVKKNPTKKFSIGSEEKELRERGGILQLIF